jgi:hypothetical protein
VQFEKFQSAEGKQNQACTRALCELAKHPLRLKETALALNHRVDLIEATLQEVRQALQPVDYLDLSPLDAFYLYCILVASEQEWYSCELPSSSSHVNKLASTRVLGECVYSRLHALHIFVPSVYSPIFGFNIGDSKDAPITFDFNRVRWTLAEDKRKLVESELMVGLRALIVSSTSEIRAELCETLVEHECLNVAVHFLSIKGIVFDIYTESALLSVVRYGLQKFPVRAMLQKIKSIFASPTFLENIRKLDAKSLGAFMYELIVNCINATSLPIFPADVNNLAKRQMLKGGKSVMCRVYCEILG